MEFLVIWIIIVIAAVLNVRKSAKRQNKNTGAAVYRQPPQQQSRRQPYQPPQQQSRRQPYQPPQQQSRQPYQPRQQSGGQFYQQQSRGQQSGGQQELKNRLRQKYGNTQSPRPAQGAGNIADRTAADTTQYTADKLQTSGTAADSFQWIGAISLADSSQTMRQVNDLIIMGYQPDLSFERDFIGEGVEMLSRYETLQN